MLAALLFWSLSRNINSEKHEQGPQLTTLKYSLDVLFGKWLQIAVLTSTPGPLLLTAKQCFSPTPPSPSRIYKTAVLSSLWVCVCVCVCVCVWMAEQVSQSPPSLRGGTVSKHAEYRLESNANQLLSYAAPDLWWTLRRWMLPRLSIEIFWPAAARAYFLRFPSPGMPPPDE